MKIKSGALWNDRGDKRYGFVAKDRKDDGRTRYGFGIDNVGDPYRGASDNELATLLGTLDYGYDGDTVYAGVTPNVVSGKYDMPIVGGGNIAGGFADIGGLDFRANAINQPGQNTEYAAGINWGTNAPGEFRLPDFYKSLDTPLGQLSVGTNDGNPNIGGTFTPNNYIQAIINLLRGR